MILKDFTDEYLGTATVHVTAEDDCMLITGNAGHIDYGPYADCKVRAIYAQGNELFIQIQTDKRTRAEQCLINNGIHPDDAPIVLQTLGYILLDKELYPEGV